MKRVDFEELVELGGFEEAMRNLEEEQNFVTTYDLLKEFAKTKLDEGDLYLAFHILRALINAENSSDEWSDYFCYDYTAGTCDTPKMLSTVDDVAEYVGFEIEYDPAQVRFDWDDSLEGKVAAFADNIDELKKNFNRDNPEFVGVISKNRQSTNTSFPFVCNNEYRYRFVYLLEKDLEVKQ